MPQRTPTNRVEDRWPRFGSVEAMLAEARSRLDRLDPWQAVAALAGGAMLVDIRPVWQRAEHGEVGGALIVERNHLEWRLHPASDARLEWARPGQRWIVLCTEGYTSSLAAAALVSLGVPATDLVGGIEAWRAAGLPITPGPTSVECIVGMDAGMDVGTDASRTSARRAGTRLHG